MPTVSVVMPAFNAGKTIGAAIESVIGQTYANWELIVCDDCSPDDTAGIVERYAATDDRIKLLRMSKNSGAARRPRLKAISISRGRYIVYLDADDFLQDISIEKLTERAVATDADIISQYIVFLDSEGKESVRIPSLSFNMEQVITGREAFKLTIGGWKIGANGALFKRELFNNILLDIEKRKNHLYADEIDTRLLFLQASRIGFCRSCYYYGNNSESVTRTFNKKSFAMLTANEELAELVESNFADDIVLLKRMYTQWLDIVLSKQALFFRKHKLLSKDERQEIRKTLKDSYVKVLRKAPYIDYPFLKRILFIKGGYPVFLSAAYLYAHARRR